MLAHFIVHHHTRTPCTYVSKQNTLLLMVDVTLLLPHLFYPQVCLPGVSAAVPELIVGTARMAPWRVLLVSYLDQPTPWAFHDADGWPGRNGVGHGTNTFAKASMIECVGSYWHMLESRAMPIAFISGAAVFGISQPCLSLPPWYGTFWCDGAHGWCHLAGTAMYISSCTCTCTSTFHTCKTAGLIAVNIVGVEYTVCIACTSTYSCC